MSDDLDPVLLQAILSQKEHQRESGAGKGKKLTPEQAEARRRRLWVSIAKKEIPKVGSYLLELSLVMRKWGLMHGLK
ncbi:hypothetical protein DPMN_094415 [Dreissena polymorpha]|uniref:Uncharacterized protein n=1 Tax=Dreissena polymorpha TaxID=45954 RepID=A0A9D4L633_DREPO|nr:hypothetical protein DPMN_094415 [Dreissena polymorpha]